MYNETQAEQLRKASENDDFQIKHPIGQNDPTDPWNASRFQDDEAESADPLSLHGRGSVKSPATRRSKFDTPWYIKKYLRDPSTGEKHLVTRSLKKEQWDEIDRAAMAARLLGMPFSVHLCLKPDHDHDGRRLDDMTPLERMRYWTRFENKIRSHCKRHGFPCAFILVRESDPDTHTGEHAHFMVPVPPSEVDRFVRVTTGWCEATKEWVSKGWCHNAWAKKIDNKELLVGGRVQSIAAYLGKACPQRSFSDPTFSYRKSGAVAGPRYKITRNIGVKAQKSIAGHLDMKMRALDRLRGERKRAEFIRSLRMKRENVWAPAGGAYGDGFEPEHHQSG